MWTCSCLILIFIVGITASLPSDTVLRKLDPGLRYQYATDSKGENHLVDLWQTAADLYETARFNPSTDNAYHLFTRSNPTISQPLVLNNGGILQQSNYNSAKRTIVLLHGWRDDGALSNFNIVLVEAFLAAEDVNVIIVDWNAGSNSINYRLVILNTISSGEAVANFIQWLMQESGSTAEQFHLVGHGFGGHQAAIIGRNLNGRIGYITGLDPALIGWVNNIFRFQPSDGMYTEVIHTNYGVHGYLADLAQVDFYPNGGISMPGCDSNRCDHDRSFFFFAESLKYGGFIGQECFSYHLAVLNLCNELPGRLQMGGLEPKSGRTGVYWLETNAAPPFSKH